MEFQKKSYETPNKRRKKLEFIDFSLVIPVSTRYTNYFDEA